MRLILPFLILFFGTPFMAFAQHMDDQLKYLNQKPPGLTPEIFAPELISKKSEYEFGSVFNKEGDEFYYGVDVGGSTEIRFTKLENNTWTEPIAILAHNSYGFNDPFLSPDEDRLYFISQKSLNGSGAKQDHDIWFVEKSENGWSEPINAGLNINTVKNEYYISFTSKGRMYFSSEKGGGNNFDIYYSDYVAGEFQPAVKLDGAVNTEFYEADVYVAPDESYIIFCARRPDGLGRGDLYISFKNSEGNWTPSISMGNEINTKGHELCPFVSVDGKYFFYTSNEDIYWVSAEIITKLKAKSK